MKSTMRMHVIALAAAAAGAGLAPAALATAPGTNGQIAFRRYLGPDRTNGAIFVAAPDGSGERRITSPPANASDDYPDLASDGSFVAFQRCGRTGCHLYTVHTDGSGLRMIGSASVDRSYPAISREASTGPNWSAAFGEKEQRTRIRAIRGAAGVTCRLAPASALNMPAHTPAPAGTHPTRRA